MAFSVSPYVLVNELDLTGTIQAASTSNGCLLLRNAYKGQEYNYTEISNSNELITYFGIPTDDSYIDMLTGVAFLTESNSLKCIRVMPDAAKYSGLKVRGTYNSSTVEISASERSVVSLDNATFDNTTFPDEVSNQGGYGIDDSMWFIASSRGAWGNNIRVLVVDKYFYDSVKYFNKTTKTIAYPSSYTITSDTQAASAAVLEAYNNYIDYSTGGSTSEAKGKVFSIISSTSVNLKDTSEFLIIIQAISQGDTVWQTKEAWQVSIDETAVDSTGSSKFCETIINNRSSYIRMALNPSIKITSSLTAAEISTRKMIIGMLEFAPLLSGSNGGTLSSSEEVSACITALNLFGNAEESDVQIIIDGGKPIDVKKAMIELAESRRDCMAILDVPSDTVFNVTSPDQEIITWIRNFSPNSSYVAFYGNWLEVYDRWNKKYRWIPASGYAASIWAYTDSINAPWFAPSGYNRGIIRGPRRIAWNPDFTDRNTIMEEGVNPIIQVSGTGILILGQKTAYEESSAFQDINVRRLFITLEKTIATRAKYYLEEPNDATTRLRFVNEIEPYLKGVKSSRGIYAYSVICDETNNTDELIDQDAMRCDIFIQPTRTASKIVLNFVGTPTGSDFSEISINDYTVNGVVM